MLPSDTATTPTFDTEQHLRKVMRLPELTDDYKDDYEKRRNQDGTQPEDSNTKKPESKNIDDKTLKEDDSKTQAAVKAAIDARKKLIDLLLS